MSDHTTCQRRPAPIFDNIPIELRQRAQWVVWADQKRDGKTTKIPYTPGTLQKARANAPSTWSTFESAEAAYLERPDFFAGIGYMFTKDDPYVGVDFDHSIDEHGNISSFALEHRPNSYCEISWSGHGYKALVKATIPGGRKTPQAEVYSERRFFALTGNILPGSPRVILEDQPAIDRLLHALGCERREVKDGSAGSGSRAERAAAIPEDEWDAGRRLRRQGFNRLLARLRASAVSRKTHKDDTQLGYLLHEDYRGFHERWPAAGLVRGDGSLDSSQIRACMASNIRSRGFTFPEFVALMSYFYGEECAAKWGTKQAVREEFAALWFMGRTPRTDDVRPAPAAQPAPRGRAGDHAALLERAYNVLRDYMVGTQAIGTTQEFAETIGVDRRTMITLLQELVEAKRITYRRLGSHAGIVVQFCDVIYSQNDGIDMPRQDAKNGRSNEDAMSAEPIIDHITPDVIYSDETDDGLSAPASVETAIERGADERECGAPLYIESRSLSNCVDPRPTITPENSLRKRVDLPALPFLVEQLMREMPRLRVIEATGEEKAWPVTFRRVVEEVNAQYPGAWPESFVRAAYDRVHALQKRETFGTLRKKSRQALSREMHNKALVVAHHERKAADAEMPEIAEHYAKAANRIRGSMALLHWERSQRDAKEADRLEREGYTLVEQEEFMELAARASPGRQETGRAACVSSPASNEARTLIEHLKARKS